MNKTTLVIGASENTERYSNMAIKLLKKKGIDVFAVGNKEGMVDGIKIYTYETQFENVHTITLYVGPKNQKDLYNYIIETNPKRIIFNPGTENSELKDLAEHKGIHTEYACTLVLLNIGNY